MADNNNIKTFTASDIERYHKGQLSSAERHALEKAALDDPFLADALEGYTVPGVNITADIAELKRRLAEKTEEHKVIPLPGGGRSSFRWLRAAVAILFIAGAGLIAYLFLFDRRPDEIAQEIAKSSQKEATPVETKEQANAAPQLTTTDSSDVTISSNAVTAGTTAANNNNIEKNTPTELSLAPATAEEADTEAGIAKDNRPGNVIRKEELAKTTAPAKIEEAKTDDAIKNIPGNDNVYYKSAVTAKNDADKAKERAAFKKPASHDTGNAYKPLNETVAAPSGIANNNYRKQQGLPPANNINYFRGKVTDGNNNALPFANVTNTTDNVGTYTDSKGYFALVSTDSVLNVQVRSLGFENNKVSLRSDLGSNQVMMQEDRSLTAKVLDTVKRNYTARTRDGNLTFEEPEPADGWLSYDTYLFNNLNVPENFDVKKSTEGDAVELSFEVNKYGDPVNIRVEKSLCDKCDKEAIRLVKEGPRWKRKAKKGKRTTVKIPFIKPADW